MTSRLERQAAKALAAALEAEAVADQKASILTQKQRRARDAKRFQNGELLERYGMRDVAGDVVRGISIEYQDERARSRWERLGREARLREEKEAENLPVSVVITLPMPFPRSAAVTLKALRFKEGPERVWNGRMILREALDLASEWGGEARAVGADEPIPIPLAAE